MKQKPLITKLDPIWKAGIGPGWHSLLEELHEKLLEVDPDYEIGQVKEKFGGLRFYMESSSDEARDINADYEAKSFRVCEECGREGQLHRRPPHGFVQTLCKTCGTKEGMEPCDEDGEIE